MRKLRTVAPVLAAMLVLAACGDDADTTDDADAPAEPAGDEAADTDEPDAEEPDTDADADADADDGDADDGDAAAASLDCSTIEIMVPYSPGGGSDQQVRRLEPHLAEAFDANINIVYREGGEGAVAWSALQEAEPDGCTVANVVSPNIILASQQDAAQTFTPDEFAYIAWTETAPNGLVVPIESPYETIDDFLEAARENPGSITVGGSGAQGELTADQIMETADIDVTYVPLEGGVGDTVPQLMGGHLDAAVFGSSHAVNYQDSLRALALAGPERSEALGDAPTFEEEGYEGVTVATSWGLIAPPGTPDDVIQAWNDAVRAAVDTDEMRETLIDAGLTPLTMTPEETMDFTREQMDAFAEN